MQPATQVEEADGCYPRSNAPQSTYAENLFVVFHDNDIGLFEEVFAIIDFHDALTSDRPYHPAWSPEKAQEYIRSEAALRLGTRHTFSRRQDTLVLRPISGTGCCRSRYRMNRSCRFSR